MPWTMVMTPQAKRDHKKIRATPLKRKIEVMLAELLEDPYRPPLEKLSGDLRGAYSKRINRQHRLVYEPIDGERVVKILRMWTHYE